MANIFNDILDSLKKWGQDQDKKARQNQQQQLQLAQTAINTAKKPVTTTQQT